MDFVRFSSDDSYHLDGFVISSSFQKSRWSFPELVSVKERVPLDNVPRELLITKG